MIGSVSFGTHRKSAATITAVLALGLTMLGQVRASMAGPQSAEAEFFVANNGSDQWPGTKARPFATLQRAQSAARSAAVRMTSNVIVNIRGGTYRMRAPLELSAEAGDSGRNGNRIVYRAYGYGTPRQEKVVLSGGREVTGWQRASGGAWRAAVGDLETRQLYVNGRRAEWAALDTGLSALSLIRTESGYRTSSPVPQTWNAPEDIEFVYRGAYQWSEPRCGVESIAAAGDSTVITMKQPCFRHLLQVFPENGFPAATLRPSSIENSKSFLSRAGTFYLDRSVPGAHVLYYVPRPDENLARASVIAPELETLISGTGTPYAPLRDIEFKGLTFSHATWLFPSSSNGFVHYIAGFYENGDGPGGFGVFTDQYRAIPGHLAFIHAERIVFEGNRFEHLGGQALEIVGSNNVVRGNEFTDIANGAILVGDARPVSEIDAVSRDNVIQNNWIHGIGVQYHGGTPILAREVSGLEISHNQINDVPYSGIVVFGFPAHTDASQSTNEIRNNRVFDVMKVLSDGGGIYVTAKQGPSFESGTVTSGNVVDLRDLADTARISMGIYSDWGSAWQRISDNVILGADPAVGGCSWPQVAEIEHLDYSGNFWSSDQPWWPCPGPVRDINLANNTLLPQQGSMAACLAERACARIVSRAGLQPRFWSLFWPDRRR